MPSLARSVLFSKLRAALPNARSLSAGDEVTPALLEVPAFGTAQVYLYTVTPDRSTSGRPLGEYKIQLMVSGQQRGEPGHFHFQRGAYVALLGFSPDFGVFVGWEARRYPEFAWSRNVQVREGLLEEARQTGWAVDTPRMLRAGEEVRVAFTSRNLHEYLELSRSADHADYSGVVREAHFLTRGARPTKAQTPADEVHVARQRYLVERLQRDSAFAPGVKLQFGYSCAVCGIQLDIVEGAHIIPVREPRSSDEVWNGLSLCPNHHSLFDRRLLHVGGDLIVVLDHEIIAFLEREQRARGSDVLLRAFDGRPIRPPDFWKTNARLRRKMQTALADRLASSGPV
jgi:putative restriction endonuclease